MAYTCKTCGVSAKLPGHLCNPVDETPDSALCSTSDSAKESVCQEKITEMHYTCDSCGRVSADSGRLCNPIKTG